MEKTIKGKNFYQVLLGGLDSAIEIARLLQQECIMSESGADPSTFVYDVAEGDKNLAVDISIERDGFSFSATSVYGVNKLQQIIQGVKALESKSGCMYDAPTPWPRKSKGEIKPRKSKGEIKISTIRPSMKTGGFEVSYRVRGGRDGGFFGETYASRDVLLGDKELDALYRRIKK